ncbi:MAG: hypothetical protein WBM40_20925 [Thiohalocapsa sp.]
MKEPVGAVAGALYELAAPLPAVPNHTEHDIERLVKVGAAALLSVVEQRRIERVLVEQIGRRIFAQADAPEQFTGGRATL